MKEKRKKIPGAKKDSPKKNNSTKNHKVRPAGIKKQTSASETVKEQLHFINQVAMTLPDMLSVMDINTRELIYANHHPFKAHGYNLKKMKRMTREDREELIHPEDIKLLHKYFSNFKTYTGHQIQTLEYRARNSKENWKWYRVRGKVFSRNQKGTATHCVNIVTDISELKTAEQKLIKERSLLMEAEKTGLMGSWEMNVQTGKLNWSDELYRMFGLVPQSRDVSSDFYLNTYVHPDDRRTVLKQLEDLYEKQKEYPVEYRITTKHGDRVVFSQPRILRDDKGRPRVYMGIVRDITAQKMAEKVLLQQELWQQKEILNAMLTAQEHERERIGEALHNGVAQLLYGIQTRLQLLTANSEKDRKTLNEILSITVDAIKDTRNISFELVPAVLKDYGIEVALNALLQRIIKNKPAVQVRTKGLKGRLPEHCEFALYRITQELINNIIKHSHASNAVILLSLENKKIRLRVSDDGHGFQAEDVGATDGIGLQSIRNRVKLLNGTVAIESEKGKGTDISVSIPLA